MRVEPTSERTKDYIWFGENCLRKALRTGTSGTSAITDGATVIICKYTFSPPKAVLIDVFSGNFISTPRKFKINDGYNADGQEQGDGKLDYPMDDLTDTSQVFEASGGVTRGSEVYGNVDWVGLNKEVLTWRGPTGRTLPCPTDTAITGLSVSDIKFDEMGADKWTCFGSNIYQQGAVLATIPTKGDVAPKVLGAAISKYKDSNDQEHEVLLCIVNNHYVDRIGFFDEVWVQYGGEELEGWEIIHSRAGGRPSLCWFFNQSGNKATQGSQEYIINLASKDVEIKAYSIGEGTYSFATTADGFTITQDGTYKVYSDYKGNERVTAEIKVSENTIHIMSAVNTSTITNETVYTLGTETQADIYVTGPDAADVGSVYSFAGTPGSCDGTTAQWEFAGGTISNSGTILSISGCGMSSVSVTIGGASASKQVMLPSGKWEAGPLNIYKSNYYDYPSITVVVDTQKVTEYYSRSYQDQPLAYSNPVHYWFVPYGCCTPCGGAVGDFSYTTSWGCTYFINGQATVSAIPCDVLACHDPVLTDQCAGYFECGGGGPGAEMSCPQVRQPCNYAFAQQIETWVCP